MKKKNKNENIVWTFGGALVGGVLAHGYLLGNRISFHDEVASLFGIGTTWKSGRWGLGIVHWIMDNTLGKYSLSFLAVIVSLLLISVTACLIVDILEISRRDICFILGAAMAVFPVISAIFLFMFTAPSYFIALLSIVSAVWLTEKWKYGWIAAIFSVAFSLGIYPAFLGVGLTVIVLVIIKQCFTKEVKIIVFSLIKYMGIMLGGFFLHLRMVNLFLKITGNKLTGYMGINSMMDVSLMKRIKRIKDCYVEMYNVLVVGEPGITEVWCSQVMAIALFLFIIICTILLLPQIHTWYKKIIYIVAVAALPISMNFIYIMVPAEVPVHGLMKYPLICLFIIALFLVSMLYQNTKKLNYFAGRIICGCCILSIIAYIHYDNTAYMKVGFVQEQTTSYFTTLITQIKSCDGYKDEYPVVYIGAWNIEDKSLTINDGYKIEYSLFALDLKDWINNNAYIEYVKNHCGFSPTILQMDEIDEWEEIDNMAMYPDDGSIRVIDEKVIVKFAERQ